jgi:ABC-type multidrug transport system fused ATPase/permease subunit
MSSPGNVELGMIDVNEVLRQATMEEEVGVQEMIRKASVWNIGSFRGHGMDAIPEDAEAGEGGELFRALASEENSSGRSRQNSTGHNHVRSRTSTLQDTESPILTRERGMSLFKAENPDNAPSILSFKNITVSVGKEPTKKILLNNISGSITGGFWAIMGASGGGKTTLLSTLSLRLDPGKMNISGNFSLNGREYSKSVLKAMSAYVMQDDLLVRVHTQGIGSDRI